MSIAAAFASIKTAMETLGKLRDLTKQMQQVELKSIIGELANNLADAKIQLADLKEELNALKDENRSLKGKGEAEKPKVRYGCYMFEGDENLYCPACYDTQGKKYLTTRISSLGRRCAVCKTVLGKG
jgi:hypothetical protein